MFQDILIQLSTTKVKIINMENALIRLALLEIVNIVNNPSEIMFVSNKKNLRIYLLLLKLLQNGHLKIQ